MNVKRRDFLKFLATSICIACLPYSLISYAASLIKDPSRDPYSIFGLSVASGDPTPNGAIIWTRINPETYVPGEPLFFEVARDPEFRDPRLRGVVGGSFGPERDYTVKVDLDPHLKPNTVYYYRFIYRGVSSRVGRLRTLPGPNDNVERVRFAVITCQDYTNGYYPAFHYIAQEDVDYVIHLGDFIYESTDDYRYQHPLPDRQLRLPSGGKYAMNLEDYRYIYRTYRSDKFLQEAMERHTWIMIYDDHETANDLYWDYDSDTIGAPDHPYSSISDPEERRRRLTQLRLDAQQAWHEYVPARVPYDPRADHPWRRMNIYRKFKFGNLVELFMTDERQFRYPHPCGEQTYGQRYVSGCPEQYSQGRSMLGPQLNWLLEGIKGSRAIWKVWGNEVLLVPLRLTAAPLLYYDLDAWDGYAYEREYIARWVKENGIKNLVVLTGDLHSYVVAYIKVNYLDPTNNDESNMVGVELMTPAVTSANLKEILERNAQLSSILNSLPNTQGVPGHKAAVPNPGIVTEPPDLGNVPRALNNILNTLGRLAQGANEVRTITNQLMRLNEPQVGLPNMTIEELEHLVMANNPHIVYFNSHEWGYAVVEFTREACTWTIYSVDKEVNSPNASRRIVGKYLVPRDEVRIVRLA